MIVEINQTTDRNIELIEDRVERLKTLLKDADRRIGVLKTEVSRQEKTAELYTHLGSRGRKVSQGASPGEDAGAGVAGHPGSAGEQPPAAPENREAKKSRVVRLYLQGFSSQQIAAKVGVTVGEVDLMVALYEHNTEGK